MKANLMGSEPFLRALGVITYLCLASVIMQYGDKIFGKLDNHLSAVAFLLLFILSALITGGLVLIRPFTLYLDKKKSQAHALLLATIAWLALFLALAMFGLAMWVGK